MGVSRRFAPEYRQEYQQWQGYWDRQADTPQQDNVPDVRARLGHLFGLGAGKALRISQSINQPTN